MKHWLALLLLLAVTATQSPAADDGWVTLFDGTSLDDWKINERPESWKLADGVLTANGEPSHIFYVGPLAPFKDFELELEILTRENSNAGVYICTQFQDAGWPKGGLECQVNNSFAKDPRKTGSLYTVQDVLEAPAKDNEWWTYNIRLEGKKITIKVNGQVVNEYTQPDDAQPGKEFARVIGEGTFALQAHDAGSSVSFRNIRVKKLGPPASPGQKGVNMGDAAPLFTAVDDQGREWKSVDHFAKGITVVYFYPADFTGGCTKQACSYRDDFGKLQGLGVNVVGVSGDSVATHQAFKKFHDLNFTLLSDPEGAIAARFGVPVNAGEKSAKATIDGQQVTFVRTATTSRWTFVIKDGRVVAVDSKVNAAGDSAHIQEVVQALR